LDALVFQIVVIDVAFIRNCGKICDVFYVFFAPKMNALGHYVAIRQVLINAFTVNVLHFFHQIPLIANHDALISHLFAFFIAVSHLLCVKGIDVFCYANGIIGLGVNVTHVSALLLFL
jgi:hypothetical protein